MKVIVAGSRHIVNSYLVAQIITDVLIKNNIHITELVSGGARGVDKLGEEWANSNKIPIKRFPAKWDDVSVPGAVIKYNRYNEPYNAKAGFDRNLLMAQYADILIAIWDGKSKGTAHMVDLSKQHNLTVYVHHLNINT